jgi:pimeloyl-ACP methyl ester carboxylesterase
VHNLFLIDCIAERSIRETEEGWSWKADLGVKHRVTADGVIHSRDISDMGCPFAAILGRESMHGTENRVTEIEAYLGSTNVSVISDAGHHVLLDQPDEVIQDIKRRLQEWQR